VLAFDIVLSGKDKDAPRFYESFRVLGKTICHLPFKDKWQMVCLADLLLNNFN